VARHSRRDGARFDLGIDLRNTVVVNYVDATRSGTAVGTADQRTRDRVRALLLDLGPSTAAVLGERLGLSGPGVRRHLDALVADGTVTTTEPRRRPARGRGRPARLYALTDAGHAASPSAYDDLAAGALRFLAEAAGESAVEQFATARAGEIERRYRPRLDAAPDEDRPAALAAALSDDGYAATTEYLPRPGGPATQLCQHHCPVQHVAEQFPQLCEAETAALGRLLGTHVQRLATIAHGDGVCTLHIPQAATAEPTPMTDHRTPGSTDVRTRP
jgi:predicted ArsR family transcriptional regulator